jgi:hypothetical protein
LHLPLQGSDTMSHRSSESGKLGRALLPSSSILSDTYHLCGLGTVILHSYKTRLKRKQFRTMESRWLRCENIGEGMSSHMVHRPRVRFHERHAKS